LLAKPIRFDFCPRTKEWILIPHIDYAMINRRIKGKILMTQQTIEELQAELHLIRHKLSKLEAQQGNAYRQHNLPMSRGIGGWLPWMAGTLLVSGVVFAASEALFIDAKGNVGIGTDHPQAPLHVVGDAVFTEHVSIGSTIGITDPETALSVDGAATIKGDTLVGGKVGIGIGKAAPKAQLDIQQANRTGTHPDAVGLYVTGEFAPDKGAEFRHSNGTQGIGFGYNTIYATGTNASQDLNLNPRGDGKVNVSGAVQVNGSLHYQGVYQLNNEPVKTRIISPRYHLTLTGPVYSGSSKKIPQATLVELCGDGDGCEVRLGMTKWDNDISTETASRSFHFYYASNGRWRSDYGDSWGVDGDGKTTHVANPWEMCYLTDGSYSGWNDNGDKEIGMELLMWKGSKGQYQGANRTCELTLID
jgi:hypothetical protein